jgi:hypothetical protein
LGVWRVNGQFDYYVSSGRVLDRRDPCRWIQGRVSGPDEMVAVARGAQQLRVERVSKRFIVSNSTVNPMLKTKTVTLK